jgi:hypothetical protein
MANLKAIIQKNLGTTLTAAYTNTSGADAALKAFNVNQVGSNPTNIISSTPSGSSVGFLGNAVSFLDGGSTQATTLPFVIQLSENRLLLLQNLYSIYSDTFGRVEAQIVEWDGSKYINYPTTELAISASFFNGNNNTQGIGLYGVALTASKVAFVTNGSLYVATITNNTVNSTVQTLAVTGTFGSVGMKIQPVSGDTDKVVVFGRNTANTAYIAQAYNVTSGSAPTAAGTAYTAITSSTTGSYDFCLHRRTDATYFFAGPISSTAVGGNIAVFNPSTNVWTTSAATTNIVTTGSNNYPLVTVPLSTDGSSSYYTGVVVGNSSSNFDLFAQTSGTSISTTLTATVTATAQAASNSKSIYYYNLGSRKAMIVGQNYLVGISDAGTFTSLLGAGATQNVNRSILCLPFNSRPLYFYNTSAGAYANLMGRTGLTDTGFGTYTETGNFIQYGTPNGKAYVWSDTANCWFAVQGETLYALDLNGNVLAEKKLNVLFSSTSKQTVKVIAIAPNGSLGFLSDNYGAGTAVNMTVTEQLNTSTQFASFTSTVAITSPNQITSITPTSTQFSTASMQPRKAGDLLLLNDSSGTLYFTCCGLGWSTNVTMYWYTATVAAPNTNISVIGSSLLTAGAPTSLYTNANLLVTSPTTSSTQANIIYIGSKMVSDVSRTGYLSYTTTPVSFVNLSAITTLTQLSTVSDDRYVAAVNRTQTGMSAVLAPSGSDNTLTLWTTFNNTSVASVYTISSMTNALKPEVLTSQNITLICNGASGGTAITPFFQYWGLASTAPSVSGNATSTSNSILNLSKVPDKFSLSVNGVGTNATYSAYGSDATTFTMSISDGTNEFFVTPITGSPVAVATQYRSTDVYYVPVGYSVKTQAGINRQLDVMLEILEQ